MGLASAASCQLLGAACVIVGDLISERLKQARSFGCETIDLRKDATAAEQIEQIVGEPVVDAAVDCVGFGARGHGGQTGEEHPATVLNSVMELTRAGGGIGIPGLYVLAIIGKRIFLDFRRPATGHANLVSGVGSAEMDRSSG